MVRCENKKCLKKHDGSFGTGRFCCRSCANSFSTSEKRVDINTAVSLKLGGRSEIDLLNTIREVLAVDEFAGIPTIIKHAGGGVSYYRVRSIIDRHKICLKKREKDVGIDEAKERRKSGGVTKKKVVGRVNSPDNIFPAIENNTLWKHNLCEPVIRKWMKRYLLSIYGHICSICKNTEWMGKPIPLICDHIDGNHTNQDKENFRLVCGNCDMQLDTYKSKNKGNGRTYDREQYHRRLLERRVKQ